MPPRHPRHWLMTDERMGAGLWDAVARLPRGGGIVLRHHATPRVERRRLALRLRAVARRRGLVLVVAAPDPGVRADGVHGRRARRGGAGGLLTRPVHDGAEAVAAARAGADLVFVSPVFATRSHPGARPLGPVRLGLLLRRVAVPAIALGGMDAAAPRRLRGLPLAGWAAIDAWT